MVMKMLYIIRPWSVIGWVLICISTLLLILSHIKTKKKWRDMLFKWSLVGGALGCGMLVEILVVAFFNGTESRVSSMLIRRDYIFILIDTTLFLSWVVFWLFYIHEKFD